MVSPLKEVSSAARAAQDTAEFTIAELRDSVTALAKDVADVAERRTRAARHTAVDTAEAGAVEVRRTIRRQPVVAMAVAAAAGAVLALLVVPRFGSRAATRLALGSLDAERHPRRPARLRRQHSAVCLARRAVGQREPHAGLRAPGRCFEPRRHGLVDELAGRQGERLVPEGAGQGQGKAGLTGSRHRVAELSNCHPGTCCRDPARKRVSGKLTNGSRGQAPGWQLLAGYGRSSGRGMNSSSSPGTARSAWPSSRPWRRRCGPSRTRRNSTRCGAARPSARRRAASAAPATSPGSRCGRPA